MRKFISTGFVLVAGLVGTPTANSISAAGTKAPADPRLAHLNKFFAALDSPVRDLAPEFLAAADRHTLDWRLLPSIAVVESSAGKDYKNNNIFGWDSCNKKFPSVRAGIHEVAARLATSRLYRKKGVEGILNTYNPNSDYAPRVMRIMRSIGPARPVLLQN
jgi:hypothetical protein